MNYYLKRMYKVEDRVKVITNHSYLGGMTGTVKRLRRDGDVWVAFDGQLPKHLQSESGLVRMHPGHLTLNDINIHNDNKRLD